MTKIVEITYWEVLEGREDDVAEAANRFKSFTEKNLDGEFTWGYVQTGEYVGYVFGMMKWNTGAAFGTWQDVYATHPEYQKVLDAFVNHPDGQPDFLVNREVIHLAD